MRDGTTRHPIARALAASILAAAALAAPGCGIAGLRPIRALEGESQSKLTEEELAERLDKFAELFAQSIVEGVRVLAADEKDPDLQRAALVWQIQSVRTCRNCVLAADPQTAFTDTWVLCAQQRDFFTSEAFTKKFGARGAPLVAAGHSLEAEIVSIGAGFLKPAELERAKEQVNAFAKQFPIREGFARSAPLPSTSPSTVGTQLSWVTAVPMAPFRFVAGIDEGAAAIRHFSSVAERFARRVDALPQETLWEMQLLLHDVGQEPAVERTVASLESAARSGESFAATAKDFQKTAERLKETLAALPADVRKEGDALLADIDARQTELRSTIGEVRRALADAREVVEKAGAAGDGFDKTAKSLGDAAKAVEAAVQSYQAMMREIHPKDAEPKPREPGERPFDVLDWQRTADSVTKTAAELKGALVEFKSLAGDKRLADGAASAAAAARAEADAAVDHAFVRALQLLGSIAVVVVALRFIRPRRDAA